MSPYWQQVTAIARQVPPEELRRLTAKSDARGALAVTLTIATIAATLAVAARWPHPVVLVLATLLLGGQQHALAVLMHEAAHRSLFRTPWMNELVGQWLCSYPIWNDLFRYREHHLAHHLDTGSDADPDIGLVLPYPVTRSSLRRKLVRDLAGITGIGRARALLAMDLGYLTYTISTGAKPIPQEGRGWRDVAASAARNLHGVLLTNLLLAVVLRELYPLWIVAYLSPFSALLRVRAIAEHAATPSRDQALTNTRTTRAGLFARLALAPHHVNYHLEHHLFFTVPHYRLPALRRLLEEKHLLAGACYAGSYREVLAQASSRPE